MIINSVGGRVKIHYGARSFLSKVLLVNCVYHNRRKFIKQLSLKNIEALRTSGNGMSFDKVVII